MLVLQFGIPGGIELLVIFLMMFLFGAPLVVLALFLVSRRQDQSDRVEALEARVAELESELEDEHSREADRSRD